MYPHSRWTVLCAWLRGLTFPTRTTRRHNQSRRLELEGLEDRLAPTVATFQIVDSWNTGYQAQIILANDTTASITNWTLGFNFGAQITSMWNGLIAASSGGNYLVQNAGYNSTIAPGTSVTIGFLGVGNPTAAPTNYAVNGVLLGAAQTTPPPLPTLTIGNTSITENGTNTTASFTVTLSSASTQPVTVAYATANGTATAGIDYTATSGTLTFAPGQTSQTIGVGVIGNPAPAPDVTFTLTLSNPSGATLTQASATGTIHDSITQALPLLSIGSASGTEGGQTSGDLDYFHTSGSQIIDAYGNNVKIAGINWFGLEGGTFAPGGLDVGSYQSMMIQMKQLGYNTIRLPFSDQIFDAGSTPSGINYSLNPDLRGLGPLGIMDKIVNYAGQIGLRIILDDHITTTAGPNPSGLWYTSAYPQSTWINDWVQLARRYAGNPTVIGADLFNEPHGAATWGDGNTSTDWRLASENAGNAILAANPNWLIFVEGIQTTSGGATWWGGNLSAAGQYPVVLDSPDHVVYSPHDYPLDVANQYWFSDPNYPNNLPSVWTHFWGYLFIDNTAPLLLGEFGTTLATQSDQQWLSTLVNYVKGNMNNNGSSVLQPGQQGVSWTYWAWNPDSGDVGGILQSDWQTVITAKVTAVQPIMFTFPTSGSSSDQTTPGTPLTFTVTLSSASTQPVTVAYATANGTATAGIDYAATSGTLTFAPGQTSETITVPVLTDPALTSSETLSVVLSSASGVTITQGTGTGTIHPAPASGGSSGTGGGSGTISATVTAAVTDVWSSVFNENVTITNTGTQPISNWTLEFDAPFDITLLWSGTIVSQQGNTYVVQPVAYDLTIAPGASITLGFTASGNSQNNPYNFELHGQQL